MVVTPIGNVVIAAAKKTKIDNFVTVVFILSQSGNILYTKFV